MIHRHAALVGSASLLACLAAASCSNNDESTLVVGTGGTAGTFTATGGGVGVTGGTRATGGSTSQGGQGTGGTQATGGSVALGGGGNDGEGGAAVAGASAEGGMPSGGSNSGGGNAGGAAGTAGANAGAGAAGVAGGVSVDNNGKCGLGWAAGGSAGKPALDATVTPVRDATTDDWTFTFGRVRFVVSAKRSGNIYEFSIDGNNVLEPTYGSTLWPSPQHRENTSQQYTWPPPKALDGDAYTASLSGNILKLEGATATEPNTNISFTKRFWVNQASGVVTLEYTITNQASSSATWGPWEVTRVPGAGYTFAPKGPGSRSFALEDWERLLPMTLTNGINWFDYSAAQSSMTQANYVAEFDGAEGWLAHARRTSTSTPLNLLLVKSFPDAQDSAMPTKEGEIQLWANGSADTTVKRIEVEQQGEIKTLAPQGQVTWTVHWALCELPSTVALSSGSADLVTYARAHAVAQP